MFFRTDSSLCVAFAWPSPPVTGRRGPLSIATGDNTLARARAALNHCPEWLAGEGCGISQLLGPLSLTVVETENLGQVWRTLKRL